MSILISLAGFVIGLFLWSSVIGSIFATLPLQRRLKMEGSINQVNWFSVLAPLSLAAVVLALTALFLNNFFLGSLVAGIMILFNIPNLKREAYENYIRDKQPSTTEQQ